MPPLLLPSFLISVDLKLDDFFQAQQQHIKQRLVQYINTGSLTEEESKADEKEADIDTIFGCYLAYYNIPSYQFLKPLLDFVKNKVSPTPIPDADT